ncbi:MAG: MMPL family transporter [Gammaproteobacteria bacterium]|nr:MMPL family transporter [Gammaproteobacteria bacterium]
MIEKGLRAMLEWRLSLLLLILLLTTLAGWGLSRLQIDVSLQSLIAREDPARIGYEEAVRQFGSDNITVVNVRDAALWTPQKLALLARLHEDLSQLRGVERIEDLFTVSSIRGSAIGVEVFRLLAEIPQSDAEISALRRHALDNPLINGHLLSADGTVTTLLLVLKNEARSDNFNATFNRSLNRVLGGYRGEFDKLLQIGTPRIDSELKSSLIEDFIWLLPLSALLIMVLMVFMLRSFLAAMLPMITALFTIIVTFGVMGWLGLPVNLLSAMLPSLILVIGSTEATYMFSSYRQEMAASGDHPLTTAPGTQRYRAVRRMLNWMTIPLLLTVVTTAIGFASNTISGITLIRDFSLAATLAMLFSGLFTLLLVPLLLLYFGGAAAPPASGRWQRLIGKMAQWLSQLQQTSRFTARLLLFMVLLLSLFLIYHSSHIYVTNDPLSYFPKTRPLVQDALTMQRDIAGTKFFYITLKAKDDQGFLDPDNLARVEQMSDFIKKQGVFDSALSVVDLLRFVNREFHHGDSAYQTLPDSRQLNAQYLLFFHRSELLRYISSDFSRVNIIVRHNIGDSYLLNRYVGELEQVAATLSGGEIESRIVGNNLLVNSAAEKLLIEQVESLLILLLALFVLMSLLFTSMKGGLIALVPALLPMLFMFGMLGYWQIPLNPGTAMVVVIVLGIAIDGSIHLMSRYNELCRHNHDYREALVEALEDESKPLIITSVTLAGGFLVLLLSNFTVVAQFGLMAAVMMLFSLVANLVITPLLLGQVRLVALHEIYSQSENARLLAESPLFAGMSPYQIRKAIYITTLCEYQAGERLLEQGGQSDHIYLILAGRVGLSRQEAGVEKEFGSLATGAVFGEVGYIQPVLQTFDVIAQNEVKVLQFSRAEMQDHLHQFPDIAAPLNFNISILLGSRLANILGRNREQGRRESDLV